MSYLPSQSPILRLLLTLMVVSYVCWAPSALATIRCATVDIEFLLQNYHKAQQASKDLTTKQQKYRQIQMKLLERRNQVGKDISEMGNKILKMNAPPSKDSDIRKEYEELVSRYRSLGKDLEEVTKNYKQSLKKNLSITAPKSLNEIQSAIRQYARDHGYHWIIETSGESNSRLSPLIYARNAPDITREILPIINKDAPVTGKGKQPATGEENPGKPAGSP
jgi:Skp family chaperone for outer membrane proteins